MRERRREITEDGEEAGKTAGDWEIVRRRRSSRHPQQTLAKWDRWPKSVVSYFVTNIPSGCSYQTLKTECSRFGNVVDVFIAGRKSKSGDNFGFVKFDNVKDKWMLERVLGKIKIAN
ncbi:hypothetical protein SSX86_024663 [Deinandra increscens subsp. villosa]|uniref:RRM domain-containing protein n=1 Tax=Deinandra increscens subsp. villosa TaxID=3103831 RepID=A0AAP0CI03_9ASTR